MDLEAWLILGCFHLRREATRDCPKLTKLREICRRSESLQVSGASKKSVKVHYLCCEPKQWILQKGDSDSCLRMYFVMNIASSITMAPNACRPFLFCLEMHRVCNIYCYQPQSGVQDQCHLPSDLCIQVMAGLQGTPGRGDWKGCKLDINEEISFIYSKV